MERTPEISSNQKFNCSSQVDIWSLGVTLYYLCTKQFQYEGKTLSELKKQDQTAQISLEEQFKVFESLLNKMLEFNPALRIDALQVLCEVCKICNEPVNKHLEIEEQKQIYPDATSFNDNQNPFDLTIRSTNAIVNEIIQKPLIKYENGAIYQGEYDKVTKQKDGRGRYIWSSGQVYDGLWKNGLRNLYGRYVYVSGNYYIGEWKDSKINGYGKYYENSGDYYEGQYLNGKRQGLGLYKYISGDQYYGQWVNENRQGVGVFTFKNGDIYLGQWMNGQVHGIQMYIPKDGGYIEISRYKNNKRIKKLIEVDNDQE
ncbi:morn repeat protein [Stylonychia lemnae]|uniref:Morn repeat protein n=1 Tax=Stylonychia lemnae TaxID=5949 RepID=A0A077ZTA0_STYLE|nr:morn repeat protein [Stylonychia lemnae]|eukprot:CDW73108.1 morn repeat protein [Stylonychia lemnae]